MKICKASRAIWVVVTTIALSAVAAAPLVAGGGGIRSREQPLSRWALLVDPSEEARLAGLATTLKSDYSFSETRMLVGAEEATRSGIFNQMTELRNRLEQDSELVLLLSLPLRRSDDGVYFVPSDGLPEEPWTCVDLSLVIEFIANIRAENSLLIFYSCFDDLLEDRELERLTYAKHEHRGTVDIMRICDLSGVKGPGAATEEADTPKRRRVVMAALREVLEAGPAAPNLAINSRELALRLEKTAPGFAIRVQSYPEFKQAHFRFVPTAAVNTYVARYKASRPYQPRACDSDCRTENCTDVLFGQRICIPSIDLACQKAKLDCEATKAQERVAYEANGSPRSILVELVEKARTDPTPGFLVQATTFLESVAMDPDARLTQAYEWSPNMMLDFRSLAVEGLGYLALSDAQDALGRLAIAADQSDVRRLAVNQLGSTKEPRAADRAAVRSALSDPEGMVREAAVRSAVLLGDDEAALAIQGLLLDPVLEVRIAALQATSAMNWIVKHELVIELFFDPNAVVRREAATALGRLGPSAAATAALVALLDREQDDTVCQAVAFAIGRTYDRAGAVYPVAQLVAAAERGPDTVREAVAYSLGRIGGERAVHHLELFMREAEAESVRIAAAEALGVLRDFTAVSALTQASGSTSAGLRRAAVAALAAIGTPEAREGVASRLGDQNSQVRAEVRRALTAADDPQLTSSAVRQVLASTDPQAKIEAIGMLCESGGPASVDLVLGVLTEANLQLREAAIAELGCYRDPSAIQRISNALLASDPATRIGAAAALGQVDDHQAMDALLGHINSQDEALRVEVVRSLATKSDPRALEAALVASQDQSSAVRAAAAQALGLLGRLEPNPNFRSRERLELLAKGDPAIEVRRAAIEALSGSRNIM